MTPLERAKAFVKSRAARTALKIMPLALAAVTATTTAAKADVVIHPTDASFNGCVVGPGQDCSGLFKLTGESGIALSQLGLVGGVNGAHSQGIGDGRFPLNFPLSSNWDFTVNGDGAGVTTDSFFQAGVDTVPISWDFTLGSSNTALTYDWSIFYSFTDTSSTTVSGTCDSGLGVAAGTDVTGSDCSMPISGLTTLGPLSNWQVQIDVQMTNTGTPFSTENWNVNYLNIGSSPTTPPPPMPEPATLTLAAAALPFLIRRLRKS